MTLKTENVTAGVDDDILSDNCLYIFFQVHIGSSPQPCLNTTCHVIAGD